MSMYLQALLGVVLLATGAQASSGSSGLADTAHPFGAMPGQQVAVRKDSQSPALPLGFYIYLPPDYDPSHTYPLVIWLHGYGEKGNGTTELPLVQGAGLPDYINQHIEDYTTPGSSTILAPGGNPLPVVHSIVVSPQGFWGNAAYDVNFEQLMNLVSENFAVDSNRIYLTGWSYGSQGTITYARKFTSRFAAIAPFSGGGPVAANSVLVNLPIWGAESSYENASGGVTVKKMAYGISQTRPTLPNGTTVLMMNTYPWPLNTDGTVVQSAAVKPSMALFRKSLQKWVWDTTGAFNDYSTDPDVSAIFSIPVSASHSAAWQAAYKSRTFWTWLFAQSKALAPAASTPQASGM